MFYPQVLELRAPRFGRAWALRLSLLCLILIAVALAQSAYWGRLSVVQYARPILFVLFVAVLGTVFSYAITKVRHLESRVRAIGALDNLTGLLNRRAFCATAAKVVSQNGVLLALDIDHLSAINSNHGRGAGDVCLMALAQRCRELTRQSDVIGRLDGAAIAIYLPGVPAEAASEIAERLKDGIQVCTRGQVLRATISVGAVVARGQPSIETLLRFAERALDRAKLEGRARVIMRGWPKAA